MLANSIATPKVYTDMCRLKEGIAKSDGELPLPFHVQTNRKPPEVLPVKGSNMRHVRGASWRMTTKARK